MSPLLPSLFRRMPGMVFAAAIVAMTSVCLSAQTLRFRAEVHPEVQDRVLDVTGDGFDDMVGGGGVEFRNDRFQSFTRRVWPNPTRTGGWSTYPGDLDGDGDIDVLLGPFGYPGRPAVLLNDGAGNFVADTSRFVAGPDFACIGCASADLNGDGRSDALFGGFGTLTTFFQQADGTFDAERTYQVTDLVLPFRFYTYDFDDDGDMDVFARDSTSLLFRNDGAGGLSTHMRFGTAVIPYFTDLNADGHTDLLAQSVIGPVQIWIGRGSGILADETAQRLPRVWRGGADFADFDQDGDVDILVNSGRTLLRNIGNGYFNEEPTTIVGALPPSPLVFGVASDYDNDGDVDTFVGHSASTIGVFLWNTAFDLFTEVDRGTRTFRWTMQTRPGRTVVPLASFGTALVSFPSIGTLLLDPTTLVAGPAIPVDAQGRASMSIPVPSSPASFGLEVYWQGVDIDPLTGTVRLSNGRRAVVPPL